LAMGVAVLLATVLLPVAHAEQTERELMESRRNSPIVKGPAFRRVNGGQKLDEPTFGEKFMLKNTKGKGGTKGTRGYDASHRLQR